MQKLIISLFYTIFVATVAVAQTGVTVHIDKGGIDIRPDALLSYYQAPHDRNLWLQQQKIPQSQWPLLFEIARAGNTTLEKVWEVRRQVSTWQDVLNTLTIPTTYFYYDVPNSEQLAPPYGRAYGYHRNNPNEVVKWSDDDLVKLASVKFITDSTRRPVQESVVIYQNQPDFIRSQDNANKIQKTKPDHKVRSDKTPNHNPKVKATHKTKDKQSKGKNKNKKKS